MQCNSATSEPPLSPAERKAKVEAMVAAGGLSAERAKLIDFRAPTAAEREFAKTLLPLARECLARIGRNSA